MKHCSWHELGYFFFSFIFFTHGYTVMFPRRPWRGFLTTSAWVVRFYFTTSLMDLQYLFSSREMNPLPTPDQTEESELRMCRQVTVCKEKKKKDRKSAAQTDSDWIVGKFKMKTEDKDRNKTHGCSFSYWVLFTDSYFFNLVLRIKWSKDLWAAK